MNRNRHIISEHQEFFAKNDSSKAINRISIIMNSIRIQSKAIESVKKSNCKFTLHVKRRMTLKSDIRCFIIDDTNLTKTGFKIGKMGKVFSHTQMKPILGFKAMFLYFTDGVSQFLLNFSLHGEEGKRSNCPQGFFPKQAEFRCCMEHSNDEQIAGRSAEYLILKIKTTISMFKRSIMESVHFNYLLVDSWFTFS